MKRVLSFLLAAIFLIGIPAGASHAEEERYEPTTLEIALGGRVISDEPTHITVGNTTKVDGKFYTSQFGNNTSDIDVRYMLHGYNPVVWSTQLDFVTDPMVVESQRTSTDADGNTVYTVTLQRDLRWSDGSSISAADYVFSYLLQAHPVFNAIGADVDVWKYIVGYEAYESGETDCLAGIHLVDDYTFSMTVKAEYLPYFYELSLLFIYPSPISVIAPGCKVVETQNGAAIRNEDESIEESLLTAELLQQTVMNPATGYMSHPMMNCGPYKLVSYNASTGIVEFEINEYYKGNYEGVKPVITTVKLVPVTAAEAVNKLENGEIDLLNKAVQGDLIQSLQLLVNNGFNWMNYARLGYGYLAFSCEVGPQQFMAVRQAIAYAFDTEAYTREYLKGFGLTVNGYYGIGQWMTQAAYGNLRPVDMTDEESVLWDEMTLDNLETYSYDIHRALQLLVDDGWTLNSEGEAFDPETDSLRYKNVDGELMPLRFRFAKTIGNDAAELALSMLQESFVHLGAELVVSEVPFAEVLADHLHENSTRRYDISFMATNFISIFDPLVDFAYDENGIGSQNASGIMDEQLEQLTWEMHKTTAGDALTYEQRWLAFQKRFNELLPTMPIYSNIYFDVFADWLQNYYTNSEINWPTALLYAFVQEPEQTGINDAGEDQFGPESEVNNEE